MGIIARVIGGMSVGFMPYVLGGAVLALAAQWGYFEWQLREVKRDTWTAATLAQAKADSKEQGRLEQDAKYSRSEANACWDGIAEQQNAKAKIDAIKVKVQGTVDSGLRKEAEAQRAEAVRAKVQAARAQADADRWQQIAQSKPAADQTREQSCAKAEAIIDDRLKQRRAAP